MNRYDDEIESIILKYQKLIYKLAIDIVKCKEDAENIMQDTFLTYYKNIEEYINLGDIDKKRLVARIAINKAKDVLKSKYVKLKDSSEDAQEEILNIAADCSIEDLLVRQEKNKQIMKVVNELKEPYKTIINDYFINDYSLDKLATKLNVSKGTLKVQITRGKNILKEKLMEGGQLYEKES